MKKINYYFCAALFVIILLCGGYVFADAGVEPQDEATAVPAGEKGVTVVRDAMLKGESGESVTGLVASVTPADLKTPRSKIEITAEDGSAQEFNVKALAVIYDQQGNIMSLNEVMDGDSVKINFKTDKEGIKEAISIKLLKRK